MSDPVYRCNLKRSRPGNMSRFTCSPAELHIYFHSTKEREVVAGLEVGATYTDELGDTWERLS